MERKKLDFELPEELKAIQRRARDFVDERLKPLEKDLISRAGDGLGPIPDTTEAKLIKMAKKQGLWGIGVPEELGGTGLSTLGNCVVEEELAQTVTPFNFGDVTPILFNCNEKQREAYFLPVFNRQKQPYLALVEPDRTDVSSLEMRAKKVKGGYLLTGKKVSFSRRAENYFAIVFARTGGKGLRDGVTCFLVDRDTPGFKVMDSEAASEAPSLLKKPIVLNFDRCKVPAENVLGEEGKAFSLGKRWLPSRRIIRGARCVGVARRLLEEAASHVQSWESFGQSISLRTDVQSALSDIAIAIHACRLMVYEAAWKVDNGKPVRREAAIVKLFATRMVHDVADRAVHIFGGPPRIAEFSVERLCRDALATSAIELALEVQRSIIVRDILKEAEF